MRDALRSGRNPIAVQASDRVTPLFSVVVPVFKTRRQYLEECVRSVLSQTEQDWELLLVDDGNGPDLASDLAILAARDPRMRVIRSPKNVGIALASQLGVDAASGTFLALLDHDDTLSPVALEHVAARIVADPTVDYIYSDEDKVDESGNYCSPFFKPDWSPERFRHQMYTCHLSVLRLSLVREVGGFRPEFDGAQDYDLVLRVTERARRVAHVAEILYHWRIHAGSTSLDGNQKPAAEDARCRAVAEHCERVGIDAEVSPAAYGSVRVRRRHSVLPLVSILVPTYGKSVMLRGRDETLILNCLASVESLTTYANLEFVIVGDRRMSDHLVTAVLGATRHPIYYVDYEQPVSGFNFSEKVNIAASKAHGEYLLLLNDDVEVITEDWVEELLGLAQQGDVGAVGGKYYFEDDSIQHAGVIGVGGAYHLFYQRKAGDDPYGAHLSVPRECSILTGACLMVSRKKFLAVGGFTQSLPNNFNDVDFSLKLRGDGYRNIWTPYVEMYHFESQSRVNRVEEFEGQILLRRWGTRILQDPYYNPNLLAFDGGWQPNPDWDSVSRSWPRRTDKLDSTNLTGYLEANPDLAELVRIHPAFDIYGHFEEHGRREGRLQIAATPRPKFDRNRLSLVRATPTNFSVDGYLAANPDLLEAARQNPHWDARAHFESHGTREGRYVYQELKEPG
jgi:GT2 family glycosyltransferase